eukprot:gene25919-biopygen11781
MGGESGIWGLVPKWDRQRGIGIVKRRKRKTWDRQLQFQLDSVREHPPRGMKMVPAQDTYRTDDRSLPKLKDPALSLEKIRYDDL